MKLDLAAWRAERDQRVRALYLHELARDVDCWLEVHPEDDRFRLYRKSARSPTVHDECIIDETTDVGMIWRWLIREARLVYRWH